MAFNYSQDMEFPEDGLYQFHNNFGVYPAEDPSQLLEQSSNSNNPYPTLQFTQSATDILPINRENLCSSSPLFQKQLFPSSHSALCKTQPQSWSNVLHAPQDLEYPLQDEADWSPPNLSSARISPQNGTEGLVNLPLDNSFFRISVGPNILRDGQSMEGFPEAAPLAQQRQLNINLDQYLSEGMSEPRSGTEPLYYSDSDFTLQNKDHLFEAATEMTSSSREMSVNLSSGEDKHRKSSTHSLPSHISQDIASRPTKKRRGPPTSLLNTFNANDDQRRNHRKRFSNDGKKKIEAVRQLGACVQCRFRKRTCGTGHPCQSCMRRSGSASIAAMICTRESPFEDISILEFYCSSSRTRVVDFDVEFRHLEGSRSIFTINGKETSDHPLYIQIVKIDASSLDTYSVIRLHHIQNLRSNQDSLETKTATVPETINIVDADTLSALDVENWALEYAYNFGKNYNPQGMTFLLGYEYAALKLPYYNLVLCIVKVMAIHLLLMHGVRITATTSSSATSHHLTPDETRTIRAQIDTKLFQCLCRLMKNIYHELQRLIFKTSGQLPHDAIFPVSLTMWLLVLLQYSRAGYMENLRPKTSSKPIQSTSPSSESKTSSSHQSHHYNLLLSTFSALFRTSIPLFLDFNDKFNASLVANNEMLREMAVRNREELFNLKKRGHVRRHRCTIGYSKEGQEKMAGLIIG